MRGKDEDTGEFLAPSRSQQRREALDVLALATTLSDLEPGRLARLPVPEHLLPHIAEAVGDRLEVFLDSGIRGGQDVLKALALGAKGCFIGRAYLYGLAAMGEEGVAKALGIIREELRVSMSLTGVKNIGEISRDILYTDPGDKRRNA